MSEYMKITDIPADYDTIMKLLRDGRFNLKELETIASILYTVTPDNDKTRKIRKFYRWVGKYIVLRTSHVGTVKGIVVWPHADYLMMRVVYEGRKALQEVPYGEIRSVYFFDENGDYEYENYRSKRDADTKTVINDDVFGGEYDGDGY